MKGKMLRISDQRSIFIIANEDGTLISDTMEINYRNIGENFDIKFPVNSFVEVDPQGMLHVLDAVGKPKFHFPEIWLDTQYMILLDLHEKGIIQMN